MKGVVLVLALVVAGVAGYGFYKGWFHFYSGSDGNKATFTLSVDKDKIQEDKAKAVKTVEKAK